MATTPIPPRPPGEPPSVIQTAPNLVGFDPKNVVPSQPIYLQRNDGLLFVCLTNGTNIQIVVTYRWLAPNGEIEEGQTFSPVFTGQQNFSFPIYEGWLLGFTTRVTTAISPGQWAFAQAAVVRSPSLLIGRPQVEMIWQGYLPGQVTNGWPGTPSKEITDGAGVLRSITGATPAAGVEITETVPVQRRWSLLAFRAILTTGATVANRFPGFFVDDGANSLFLSRTNTAQVASVAVNYQAAAGLQFYNDTQNEFILPLPEPTLLKAGFRIRSSTAGLQATDQWTAPQYLVQEWGMWDS